MYYSYEDDVGGRTRKEGIVIKTDRLNNNTNLRKAYLHLMSYGGTSAVDNNNTGWMIVAGGTGSGSYNKALGFAARPVSADYSTTPENDYLAWITDNTGSTKKDACLHVWHGFEVQTKDSNDSTKKLFNVKAGQTSI
jgi:hypothetical protein